MGNKGKLGYIIVGSFLLCFSKLLRNLCVLTWNFMCSPTMCLLHVIIARQRVLLMMDGYGFFL